MPEVVGITLGAAQLGMDYGVANRVGKLSDDAAITFLGQAAAVGITSIDTSPHYGDSEKLIGCFNRLNKINLQVTTKLPSLAVLGDLGQADLNHVVLEKLEESLERLNLSTVEHFLVHSEPDLIKYGEKLVDALTRCRTVGLCKNIGVSVYSPLAARQAIELGVDTLQLPCNILDQRFDLADIPKLAVENDVKLYARSTFLQGLFFLDPGQVQGWLPEAVEPLRCVRELATEYKRPIAELAFVYVRDHVAVSSVVVGMESKDQLDENCRLMQAEPIPESLRQKIADQFKNVPEIVVNPSLWRQP